MSILEKPLKRDIETPLYEQLANLLENAILQGELVVGQKLLCENELVKLFKISRSTVRMALEILVKKDLLIRRPGKGTFVNFKLNQGLSELKSLSEVLFDQGINFSIEELKIEMINPTKDIRQKLILHKEKKVLSIERIFMVDKSPIAYSRIFIPFEKIGSSHASDFNKQSSYLVLEDICKVNIQHAKQQILATAACSHTAQLLSISKGDAVLCVTRTAYDQNNQPVEYLEQYHRSDCFSYEIEMPRNKIKYVYSE